MPNVPYKPEKSRVDDGDYEIVNFEEFCDKLPSSKTDLLTLNDNINYRLCYESEKAKYDVPEDASSSREVELQHKETSLSSPSKLKASSSFTPFGKYNPKRKGTLFSKALPKANNDAELHSKEHRYQRFSERRNIVQRICDILPGMGSGVMLIALVCALCVGTWWAVGGAVGGAWGEEHYRKLWERAHPEDVKQSLIPIPRDKTPTEHRYHDHNNLSTKNKNGTDASRKKLDSKKNSNLGHPLDSLKDVCSQTTNNMRFDCLPQVGSDNNANEAECLKRGCCWRADVSNGVPYCFYPPQYHTYRFVNMTENKHGFSVYYEKNLPSGYPDEFNEVRFDFRYISNDVLQIKIYDNKHKRFEPPFPEVPMVPGPISNLKYRVQLDNFFIGFKVIRNIDNVTIFDAQDVGGVIMSNKFLQLSAILPTDHVFGLGEKRSRFMNDMNWNTFTMFNSDQAPVEGKSLYGTQPFYLAVEHDGNSHGMILINSNAIDVVLQPTPAITYRVLGGIMNFFVFLGPTPKEVVAQYTALVGRPFMPPYWSLGFHLCKYNYGSLNETQSVWQRNRDAGIPFDVQWNDLDYMNNSNDFSYDAERFAGLPQFVHKLHNEGMHYVVLIDPGISSSEPAGDYPPFDRGLELDVFVKNSTNQPFVGKVWNKKTTVFPDFTHPSSTGYWVEMMTAFHQSVPFDGAWIDMNEPSNFLSGPMYGQCLDEDLPYKPHWIGADGLKTKTLCMDAKHYAGSHYDWHNMYALTEAIATNFALMEIRGKRPFIISRASYPGLGHYAGHWSGDVYSDWHSLRMTVPEMLSFSLFGIPMMGADICGFNGNTTLELCKRWTQLGAFYPFSRNHNSDSSTPQDPASLGAEAVRWSRAALRLRYRLLPLYYTLFWRAHLHGDTVVRPLFFETPYDSSTHAIDDQFLLGPYVMVTPIMQQGATHNKALFPPPERWYNIIDGAFLANNSWKEVDENQTVSIKGGGIVPMQEPPARGPVTTGNSRSNPLQLLAAPDRDGQAHGELYWDDGESLNSYEEKKYSYIEFKIQSKSLTSIVHWWGYGVPPLNNITLLNQPAAAKTVTINDVSCKKLNCEFIYLADTQVLQIFKVNLSLDKPLSIKWTTKRNSFKESLKFLNESFI